MTVAITLTGSDVDGDDLSYRVVTTPTHGTLGGIAPNLVYTPDANFTGSDSFTFVVNDGTDDSEEVTVSIMVTSIRGCANRREPTGRHRRGHDDPTSC